MYFYLNFRRNILKYELGKPSSKLSRTRTLIFAGWPLWKEGGQYWELLLKRIRAIAKLAVTSRKYPANLLQPVQLIYYGGARWCAVAEKCFSSLIELYSRNQTKPCPARQEELNWLIRSAEQRALAPLQQICIWRVREYLGTDLPHKVSQLAGLLPQRLRECITLNAIIDDWFEHILERYLSTRAKISLYTEHVISILLYLRESPSQIFLPVHLKNGETFSLMEILALRMPIEYVENFQSLIDSSIRDQVENNSEQIATILLAAMNCAILRNNTTLVKSMLDNLTRLGTRTLKPGRAPFNLARFLGAAVMRLNQMQPALRNSLAETSEATANCSALVVGSLGDCCESLELIREGHIIFDLSKVQYFRAVLKSPTNLIPNNRISNERRKL